MAAPPRLAAWIVTRLTVEADRQAVVGDLLEEFTALNKQFGPGRARRWFWRQALTSALPGLRRRLHERTDSHRSPKDRLMSSLWQDVRFGWRSIQRRPLVTIVAVLSLMVGISMSSVVFSLLDAAVLSPLDVKDPRGLALVLNRRGPDNVNHNFSYPDFTDYRTGQQTFVDLVAYSSAEVTMRPAGGVAEVVQAELVSGGFFPTIGPRVIAGRGIVESDDQPGAAPVIVMNEVLWRRLFGDPRAFEPKSLLVNDREFSVIGIVAATFHGMTIGSNARLWAAVHQQPVLEPTNGTNLLPRRGTSWLTLMGRLKPGATFDTAAADLNRVEASLAAVVKRQEKRQLILEPGEQGDSFLPKRTASPLQLLLGAALLVLLVACANVANLLLARATDRGREIAVRTALGASRARISRLLLVETLLLGTAGVALGLLVAVWLAGLAVPLFAEFGRPVTLDVGLNWRLLLFAVTVGIGSTMLAGLAPVLNVTRTGPAGSLGEGGRAASAGPGGTRLRSGLVVLQFALSLALIVSATLLVRTLINLRAIPTGFDLHHVALMSVDPEAAQYKAPRIRQYYADAEARLAGVPGVTAVGYGRVIPVGFGGSRTTVTVPGYQSSADEDMELNYNTVSPGYFAALGISMLAGRTLSEGDIEGRPLVAVVNDTMARRYLAEPIGGWTDLSRGWAHRSAHRSGGRGPRREVPHAPGRRAPELLPSTRATARRRRRGPRPNRRRSGGVDRHPSQNARVGRPGCPDRRSAHAPPAGRLERQRRTGGDDHRAGARAGRADPRGCWSLRLDVVHGRPARARDRRADGARRGARRRPAAGPRPRPAPRRPGQRGGPRDRHRAWTADRRTAIRRLRD